MSAGAPALAGEPRTLAPFGRRLALVSKVEHYGAYRVVWTSDADGPRDPRPGQFYMLATASEWGGGEDERPYLPRAFSHCRATPRADGGAELGFMLDAVGPGTARLAALAAGEELWLVGPVGVGFRAGGGVRDGAGNKNDLPAGSAPDRALRPLLVGGGIGVAPILALADELGELGAPVTTLLGFRSAAHAPVARLFAPEPRLATDDGSAGRRALVTDLLRDELDRDRGATVYACGPPPMLEAVRALCATRGVSAQLALESGMACGFGACFGCVVPTKGGFVRLCLDGPVLDASELETAMFAGAGH